MSDKEKLSAFLEGIGPNNSLEDIVTRFMLEHYDEFSLTRTYDFIEKLQSRFLREKVIRAGDCALIANERAAYLKNYLEGRMFKTEEAARKHVDRQIDNAQAIIDISKKV